MSGPKSRTPQITSQQQQAQRVPVQYQQVTSPPAIYKDDYPQQRPVYYQQLQFSAPLQTGAPSHDPSKVPQYMTSVQQAPSQQQTGPPGAPGAQGAPQGPISQVQMYTQGRVAGAQPYTAYQPRPQSQAPRQQRPVMNTGQPQPYYGGYQVISSAPGTHYTQHPQMQVMQGQMQPTNVVMYPRMPMYVTQAGYPVQPQTLYPTSPDGNWAIPNYGAPSPYQPQPQPQTFMQQSGGRPPSGGTQIYVQSAPAQPQPAAPHPPQPREKKLLRIVDPNSGEDRTEDILGPPKASGTTPPQSTTGSSRSTPNTSGQQSQIAAQFAKQVAATLDHPTDGTTTTSSSKPSSSPSSTPSKSAETAATETTTNSDDTAVDNMTSSTSESGAPTARDDESHDGTGRVTTAYAEEVVASLQNEQRDKPDVVPETERTSETEVVREPEPTDVVDAPEKVAPVEKPEVTAPASSKPEVVEVAPKAENVSSTKAAESEPEPAVEGKKSKHKQRVKQLDEKGRAKEGTDMDLFRDESAAEPESSPKVQQAPPTVVETPPTPVPAANKTNHVAPETAPTSTGDAPLVTNSNVSNSNDVTVNQNDVIDEEAESETTPSESVKEKNDRNNVTPEMERKKSVPKIELKYNYKEDQWSPLNPEGKKQYDRDFLLSLQDQMSSRTKPDNLPEIPDVILNTGRGNSEQQFPKYTPKTPSFDFFTPGYVKSASSGSGSRQGPGPMNRRSSQPGGKGSRDMKPQRVIEIPVQPPVELHKAETSWIKQMKEMKKEIAEAAQKESTQTEEEKETEKLFRDVRGILNKLTPQKFNKLLDQIKALEINTEKRLCGVINLIFEKAIDEPNFSVPYALLCKTLSSISVPSETQGKPVTFRVKLLARCQHEFEKDRYDEEEMVRRQQEIDAADTSDKKKELQLLLEHYRGKCKRRSTGNIRFIGELFKLKMLTEKIMHQCLVKLLDAGGEEDLECLCRLFTTIGKGIDMGDENRSKIDEYFKRMQTIIDQKKSSSRIRFLMLDVIDLRRNNWVNRRGTNDPKTIDQIHKEAALENERAAIQEQQNRQNIKLNNPKGGGGGGQNRGGQSTPRMAGSDDGWTTVQAKQTVDMSRMKLSKPTMEPDNMQLGPGFRLGPGSSWGRGSTGGSGSKQSEPDNRAGGFGIGGNRFQALGVDPRNRGTGRGMGGTPTGRMDRDSRGRPGQQGGPMGGGKRGPMGSRGSQESERESALAAVRHSSNYSRNDNSSRDSYRGDSRDSYRGDSRDSGYRDSGYRDSYRPDRSISGGLQPRRGSLGGSRGNSRENSRSRDGSANREYNARSRDASPREERAPTQETGPKQLDEAAMEGKAKAILEEYLHIDDKKEALHCISELKGQKQMDVFVRECVNYVLERSEGARKHTAFLLHDCIKQGLLSAESWLSGIRSVTELGEDYEIDIPKIWQYLAELIGPMMEDEIVPLKCLTSICLPIETPSKRGTLAVAVLEYISHREGHAKARLFWRKAQLKWTDFVDYEGDRLEEFIKDNKLEYTTADVEAHPDASLSFDEIQKVLEKMLKDKARDEQIFDWVEENVGEARRKDPKFIRALMTEVCKSAMIVTGQNPNVKYEKTALEPRAHVLQKYIDHEPELELQALYAIQALVHSLEHPSGLLRYFFEELSDLEILSDEAFKAWMNSTDPKEQIGFAVAKKSVNPFLSTLLADDDDDDGTDS